MKRFTSALACALLLTVALAAPSSAAWKNENVQWARSVLTQPGGVVIYDYTTGASAKVDTSEAFFLNECSPFTAGGDSVNAVGTLGAPSRSVTLSDTTLIGKVVVFCDSSTATTQAWGSPSMVLQAKWGTYGTWATVSTITPKPTDAAKFCVFPLLNVPTANDYGIEHAISSWWAGPQFRFVLTWGTGNVNAARVILVKHTGTD